MKKPLYANKHKEVFFYLNLSEVEFYLNLPEVDAIKNAAYVKKKPSVK